MRQRGWERIIIGSIAVVAIGYYLIEDPEPVGKTLGQEERDHALLRDGLAHINPAETPGVEWLEFSGGNRIVIGWSDRSANPDWGLVNRNAAIYGSKALGGRRVYVTSVSMFQRNQQPESMEYYCETTAFNGKVRDSSCP